MFRLRPTISSRIAALLVLTCAELASATSHLAARIDGEEIPTAAVDAMSAGEANRIRGRLTEVAREAVQDLIDRRLGVEQPRERPKLYRSHRVKLMLPGSDELETRLPPERIIASIGDNPIRAAALEEAAALRLYRLRGELYLQRRRNLDALFEHRLLQSEARRRGMSLAELEHSLSQTEPVTDAEVKDFVSRERAAGRAIEDPERVRPYLQFRRSYQRRARLLKAARERTQIHVDLRSPVRPQLPLDTQGGVTFGPAGGQVLVVYTNYRCALCRATHAEIDRLLSDTRPPRVVLRDFVYDPIEIEAAALVRCAAGTAQAAAMRKLLLNTNPPAIGKSWFSAEEMESVARLAGMTPLTLRGCTQSPEVRGRIERDTRAAQRLGFDAPPAFVAAGVPLSGMQSAGLLRDALEGRLDSELSSEASPISASARPDTTKCIHRQ